MLDLKNVLIKVKKSYILGLFILILLLSFSFIHISLLINEQKNDVTLVNIAGQQRILSQKISLNVARHKALLHSNALNQPNQSNQSSQTNLSNESSASRIIKLSGDMKKNHERLINGTEDLLLKVKYLYFKKTVGLHQRVIQFTDNAIKLADINDIKDAKVINSTMFTQNNVDSLLNELDFIAMSMESELAKKLNWIEKGVIFLWAFTLLSLIIFTYNSFKRISVVVGKSYNNLRREKNKVADFEYAINQHSIVFRVSLDHKIQYVNDKFCKLYGYCRQEILGQHQKVLGSREQAESIFNDMHAHIKSGEIWKHELCNIDSKKGIC